MNFKNLFSHVDSCYVSLNVHSESAKIPTNLIFSILPCIFVSPLTVHAVYLEVQFLAKVGGQIDTPAFRYFKQNLVRVEHCMRIM